MSYSLGYDNGYKCLVCGKKYNLDEAMIAEWKCPTCGDYIRIAAPELASGHVKIRKKAQELRQMDLVNLYGTDEIHCVLGINEQPNGQLRIGLKEFGAIKVDKTEYIDIVDGAYYENNW